MEIQIDCSFCSKTFNEKEYHDCMAKLFSLINDSSRSSKNLKTLFNDIDNLVFEGGGVKGLAYLGVLDQLVQENPKIIKNLKRVAGNSAGSIMALYIGLNLDYNDISDLMNTDYRALLDDGVNLRVAVNIDDWFGDYEYKNFRVSDVLFTAKDVISKYLSDLKKNPTAEEPQEKLKTLLKHVFKYYGSKTTFWKRTGLNITSGLLATLVTKVLLYFIIPAQTTKPNNVLRANFYRSEVEEVHEEVDEQEAQLQQTISNIAESAFEEYQEEGNPNEPQPLVMGVNGNSNSMEAMQGLIEKMKKETMDFYTSNSQQPGVELADPKLLVDKVLHWAIGELLWFAIASQTDATGKEQKNLGFFTGNIVKEKLIEGAIELKFKTLGRLKEYRQGFTFKELAAFKDEKGDPLFKPFFVTAYNPLNLLTEVFSVYHTPNAVASDCVRASMSIPVFFTPVTITENGAPRKVYYMDKNYKMVNEEVYYMDGGVLDNYPIWIFDDLKFYLDSIPEWVPKKMIGIQNHRTLGLRLMHQNNIKIYKQPYYDEKQTQRKRVGTSENGGTLFYVLKNMFGAFTGNDENQFIKYSHSQRSVFVDNLGVSPVAFDLTPTDKLNLIESGRRAIEDYKERAKTNFFGEGEKYIASFNI